ncbi:hypothetical protein AB0A77_36330 [Streptomyces varsoviensis]|uniref:terpene synthase family protein n=1 Tax=Streptomyces varsoviensis TaxID=67373 RepID=UPI0033DA4C34
MLPATSRDHSPAHDAYTSETSPRTLWDGTSLSRLQTPWHELTARPRPYPAQRNFFRSAAVAASAQWLQKTAALEQEETERLLREDVGGFVSWVYPDATARQIRALTDFHHWSVWLDDRMDRKTTTETSLSACTVLESLGNSELAPFDDFFVRMRTLGMTEHCADRFQRAMRLYGASSREEVRAREGEQRFTSLPDYVANRRKSAAMPVYYALIAWISRVDLPDELHRHPLVTRLENCCSDYCLLYNDVGSFIKEHLAGRSEGTLVRLLSALQGLSVQDTLWEAADMAAAAADDLEATSDLIDASGLSTRQCEQIHRYADGLRKFTGGVNHWSNHTCRYHVGQSWVRTAATSRSGDNHGLRDQPA